VSEFGGDHKLETTMRAELARAQAEHRKPGRPPLKNLSNGKASKVSGGGNNSEYLLRRLARDAPAILKAYEDGKYKSVRAAAKAAGLVKTPTPFEQMVKLAPKLTAVPPGASPKPEKAPPGSPEKAPSKASPIPLPTRQN
jgi:hypothetical protein